MAGSFNLAGFMRMNMARRGAKYALVRAQRSADNRQIGLGAARYKVYRNAGIFAKPPNPCGRRLRMGILSIAGILSRTHSQKAP